VKLFGSLLAKSQSIGLTTYVIPPLFVMLL